MTELNDFQLLCDLWVSIIMSTLNALQIGEYEETIGTCFVLSEDGKTRFSFFLHYIKILLD